MLRVYDLDRSDTWDQIVRSFSKYDVYYLSGYPRAFQLHGDGEPLLFYYEDKDAQFRAINVVMKRDIAADAHFRERLAPNTHFDYSTPYGYGGWLIENPQRADVAPLFEAYGEYCRTHRVVSEFVRFHPVIGNHETASPYYEVVPLGEVVSIDLTSPEKIWENFSSTCRNRVRKAAKNGVQVFHGRYPEIFEVFRGIYNRTMETDNAENYYFFSPAFYESVLNDLPEHAQVFYAQMPDGAVAAAAIMLTTNGIMDYHLGGLLREYSSVAPMNLLFYKAALWGCANGCKSLYLGGGLGSQDSSLLRFKRTFYKGELERFHIGRRIFRPEVYQMLLDMRIEEDPMFAETKFFPAYRGGGIRT